MDLNPQVTAALSLQQLAGLPVPLSPRAREIWVRSGINASSEFDDIIAAATVISEHVENESQRDTQLRLEHEQEDLLNTHSLVCANDELTRIADPREVPALSFEFIRTTEPESVMITMKFKVDDHSVTIEFCFERKLLETLKLDHACVMFDEYESHIFCEPDTVAYSELARRLERRFDHATRLAEGIFATLDQNPD